MIKGLARASSRKRRGFGRCLQPFLASLKLQKRGAAPAKATAAAQAQLNCKWQGKSFQTARLCATRLVPSQSWSEGRTQLRLQRDGKMGNVFRPAREDISASTDNGIQRPSLIGPWHRCGSPAGVGMLQLFEACSRPAATLSACLC